MAHYDKTSGQIILSPEDQKTFKEKASNMQNKRTPWADSIISWIKGDEK